MHTISRGLDWLEKVCLAVAVGCMACIPFIMGLQVFYRYVLNSSLLWSEELSIYLLVWVVFLGSAWVMRSWSHIGVPTLINACPPPVRAGLLIFSRLVTAVFIVLVIYYGTKVALSRIHAVSPSMGFSTRWIKIALPVSGGAMILFVLALLADDVTAILRRDFSRFGRQSTGFSA